MGKGGKVTAILDDAYKYLMKGKYDKALELFTKAEKMKPDDLKVKMKIAECLHRLKKLEEACDKYMEVAQGYYEKGFTPQALSVAKLLYDIKPEDPRVKELVRMIRGEEPEQPSEGAAPAEKEEKKQKKGIRIPKILFFSSLSDEEFIDVLKHLSHHSFSAGKVVLKEGEKAKAIYLLTSGEVEVRKETNGEVKVLKKLQPGSFIGLYSFFAKTALPATVVAATDAEVLVISDKHIKAIAQKYPKVQQHLEKLYIKTNFIPTLSNIPLFAGLSEEDLDEIAKRFELIKVEKGEHVIIEGSPGEAFYIIRSGSFLVSRGIGGGKRVKLAVLNDGDFFGEIALLTGKETTATVTALKKSELMKITKEKFNEILLMFPTITEQVTSYMESRLADTQKKVREALEEQGII